MEHSGDSDLLDHNGCSLGIILTSNRKTRDECLILNLFEIPIADASLINKIRAGMFFFLFDEEERKLYGVYKTSSDVSMNIIPDAFSRFGKALSTQVRFQTVLYCDPLSEDEFRESITDNYYEPTKFRRELSEMQVHKLLLLFAAKQINIQLPHSGINKFSLESRFAETSDDIKKYIVMSRNYESRSKRNSNLHQAIPSVSSGLEHETSLYSTFSTLEDPEVLPHCIYSSSRENPGNIYSPRLRVKRPFVESPPSYQNDSYTLSLPDHAHHEADICYFPHEPYYPTNILTSSKPSNDIHDRVSMPGFYDHVSESDFSKTDPADLSSAREYDHLLDLETVDGKQGAYKEVAGGVNHSYVRGSARAARASLASDVIPWAKNGQSTQEMLEPTYPSYQESQRQLPPRFLRRVVVSDHRCKSACSRKMKEGSQSCPAVPGKSKLCVAAPPDRTSVFSRLSGRRTSPERKIVKNKRQFETPVEFSSKKKNTPTKSHSQRVAVEDTEGLVLERSSSVDWQDSNSGLVVENKNAIGQLPAISFKRRSEWKKAADQKSSLLEREDGELIENKPKRNRLRRPSLVDEECAEKRNVSPSTQPLSDACESNEAKAADQRNDTSLSKMSKKISRRGRLTAQHADFGSK